MLHEQRSQSTTPEQVLVANAFAESFGYEKQQNGMLCKGSDRVQPSFILSIAYRLGWDCAALCLRIPGKCTFGTLEAKMNRKEPPKA